MLIGCSKDKPNPVQPEDTSTSTWVENGNYWRSLIDATSEVDFTFFNFASRETVSVSDPQTDTTWDIAFKRYQIILNGGVSGDKGVMGVDLATTGSPDSIDFAAVLDTPDVSADDWQEDSFVLAVDAWYSYDPFAHAIVPTEYVYVLKDALGQYVKFQVTDMFDASMPPDMGSVTCRFVYAASGNDLTGQPDTVTLDVGTGTGYIDFSVASEVMPVDPEISLDWDIAFTNYEIHLNAEVFGPGAARAYPAYLDGDLIDNPTDFDGLTYAPTQVQGYMADQLGSALTDWYLYNDVTHQLSSLDHVYLIKIGDKVYKLQIHSYYHPDLPPATGDGWFTFFWAELY